MNKKVVIVLVAVLVIVSGIGYWLVSASGPTGGRDHLSIAEARSVVASQPGVTVKIGGTVAPGTVDWNSAAQSVRFVLTDDVERLEVVYRGFPPQDFKPGAPLVVEGRLTGDGPIEAVALTSKESPLCKACHYLGD